jgi:hypothetical protein
MQDQPSLLNKLIAEQFLTANRHDQKQLISNSKGTGIEVPSTGTMLSSAYEQLRNAAEYAEEHLLLQRAIKRFCKLNLFLTSRRRSNLGRELIIELVQAGYLENGTIGSDIADKLSRKFDKYMKLYGQLRETHMNKELAVSWMLAFTSVEAENMLNPNNRQQVIILPAYQHFLRVIPKDQFDSKDDRESFEICLYIATHQALLKSDADIIRYDLFKLYKLSLDDLHGFRLFNEQLDKYYSSRLTARLKRIVSRYGAPFRVMKSLIDDNPDALVFLDDKPVFMQLYKEQIALDYKQLQYRLNRGLIKSIIFIIITKVIIGLAIEVPYDLLMRGFVVILPLTINLLFPPLFMASLKAGLRAPSAANAQSVYNNMGSLLYGENDLQIMVPRRRYQSKATRLLYAIFFAIPLALILLVLHKVGFNVVQMGIFFIFFSTASFLGFRLSTMVRDYELISRQTGLLASLRDFFYLPFILIGQWLSRKYGKINLVARFLDIAIELPLKATLRLLRQWIKFINEKQEELY